jgi:hypothetical protein
MNARSEDLMLAHRGFVFSQALTLYTTPVVYLYFDRLRIWWGKQRERAVVAPQSAFGLPNAT